MEFVSQIAAVAAVLGLLGGALWWLRRHGVAAVVPVRRGSLRRMECLERQPLAPQHSLHVVRFGEKLLLVACSPAGSAVLESVPWRESEPQAGGRA